MEKRAVDCHQCPTHEIKLAGKEHKTAVRQLQRDPVLLTELGNRAVAGRKLLEQPNELEITLRLPLKTARGADLIEIAVKIQLQKVGRIVRRLARSPTGIGMTKPELLHIERGNVSLNRTHRIVRSDIIFNPWRQKTRLLPACAGLELAIRHNQNRTSMRHPLH